MAPSESPRANRPCAIPRTGSGRCHIWLGAEEASAPLWPPIVRNRKQKNSSSFQKMWAHRIEIKQKQSVGHDWRSSLLQTSCMLQLCIEIRYAKVLIERVYMCPCLHWNQCIHCFGPNGSHSLPNNAQKCWTTWQTELFTNQSEIDLTNLSCVWFAAVTCSRFEPAVILELSGSLVGDHGCTAPHTHWFPKLKTASQRKART